MSTFRERHVPKAGVAAGRLLLFYTLKLRFLATVWVRMEVARQDEHAGLGLEEIGSGRPELRASKPKDLRWERHETYCTVFFLRKLSCSEGFLAFYARSFGMRKNSGQLSSRLGTWSVFRKCFRCPYVYFSRCDAVCVCSSVSFLFFL